MGAKFTALTATGTATACTKDADCYPASTKSGGIYAVATTDAEKAKRCCQYQEVLVLPTGDATVKATGDSLLEGWTSDGLSIVVGEYGLRCSTDYPANWTYMESMKTTWGATMVVDAKTGVVTLPVDKSGSSWKMYCDGGAAVLAVATTAAVALTVSVY